MNVIHLECGLCGLQHEAHRLHSLCTACGKPLLVRYDLDRAKMTLTKESLAARRPDLWRYREVLPVEDDNNIVSLGEGWTPLLRATRLSRRVGIQDLFIKDESQNPTQSFKARGMATAVSMAKELGAKKLAVPCAGNAAGALAAYAARAGLKSYIFMPRDTPRANVVECEQTGANVTLMDGLITDCGAEVARRKEKEGWFDVSTLKEPYRVEGKKTLGYEIAEQLNWELPDVILYPTGGGTGLIGMWKAFKEMMALGWIEHKLPRMIAVQAEECQPIVQTWKGNQLNSKNYMGKPSLANGLAVPTPFGEDLIIEVLRESGGLPIAISDEAMIKSAKQLAKDEGLLVAPEGGALLEALLLLIRKERIQPSEKILLLNTGSAFKYLENIL